MNGILGLHVRGGPAGTSRSLTQRDCFASWFLTTIFFSPTPPTIKCQKRQLDKVQGQSFGGVAQALSQLVPQELGVAKAGCPHRDQPLPVEEEPTSFLYKVHLFSLGSEDTQPSGAQGSIPVGCVSSQKCKMEMSTWTMPHRDPGLHRACARQKELLCDKCLAN